MNKARLIEHIADLVQNKKIEGIGDIRDESDRDGMRIVIELKRDEESQLILNQLYKHTQLQESFGMILLAIVGGQPRELGPGAVAAPVHRASRGCGPPAHSIRFAQSRRARTYFARLQESPRTLDDIIKLIRRSKSPKEAKEGLMAEWKFSDRQAQAILDLQLHRLTQLEREKILQELKELQEKIAELKSHSRQREETAQRDRRRAERHREALWR